MASDAQNREESCERTGAVIGQYRLTGLGALADWMCLWVGGAYTDRVGVFYARWSCAASATARKRNCYSLWW